MAYIKKILDVVALLWILAGYVFILAFSPFLFDSPNASQLVAWLIFIGTTAAICAIPLAWSGFRVHYDTWLIRVGAKKRFAVIVALLWLIIPFVFWNF